MKILAEGPDGRLQMLELESFDLEVRLQEMIATYPELLLTGLADDDDRQIWTIGWEVATDAGSLDVLLLDSTGRLWIVETKLARNTEVRKQVVGQVLGYASCVSEWTADDILRVGASYLESVGDESAASLTAFLTESLGDEAAAERLLEEAEHKLGRGDLHAVIVVDSIPRQLRRLVEFVNAHATFELLALQLETTEHDGSRLFIPTVSGQSATRSAASPPRRIRPWDEESFFTVLADQHPETVDAARSLYEWALSDPDLEVRFGSGADTGSVLIESWFDDSDHRQDLSVFSMWTNGALSGTWAYKDKLRGKPFWPEYVAEFAEITGTEQHLEASRSVPIAIFDPERRERLMAAVTSLIRRARASQNV